MDDNQKFHFNNKKDRWELEDVPLWEILEDQEVNQDRDCIFIATIAFCMLCYAKNQYSNILQVMADSFIYTDNKTKHIIDYYMSFLVIYKIVRQAFQANILVIIKKL